jgi:hypothetical protein
LLPWQDFIARGYTKGYVVETRVCKICGAEKPLSEFPRCPTCIGGVKYQCKVCTTQRARERAIRLRAAGLCVQCGKPVLPGYTVCEYHRERQRLDSARQRGRCVEQGICTVCGGPVITGKTMCPGCTAEQKVQRRLRKQRAVEYLGGQCVDCGLKTDKYEQYDFHHVVGKNDRNRQITKIIAWGNWEETRRELDKCVLLCANCHRTRHVVSKGERH